MRVVEQKETTHSGSRYRLCWIRDRRRVCGRLWTRFQGALSQFAVHRRVEERIAGATGRMKVRVQFYAHLRDLTGMRELDVDVTEGTTVRDVLERVYALQPKLRPHDKSILIGAGVEFVDRKHQLSPGDEISIMPPVQGG